jgi:hypothetical protein
MTLGEIILHAAGVGLLCAYLVARHRRRMLHTPLPPEDSSTWHGHGLDTATIQPRWQSVRRDPFTALRKPPSRAAAARQRVAWVRQMISRLPYFQQGHAHDD